MAKSWSFVMRAVLSGQHLTIATTPGRGGSSGHHGSVKHEDPDTDGLTKACRPKGRCSWRWSMTTKGSAQMILRGQERHNGAACWREALCERFEPATAVRVQSPLQGQFSMYQRSWRRLLTSRGKHCDWERSFLRYELASGA